MGRKLVPDCFESQEEYERFHHLDIAGLADNDLIDEVCAIRPLLWWQPEGHDWLRARVKMLESELAKRRFPKRQGVRR